MLPTFKRRYLEPGASTKWVQVSHRRTAIEYAIAGIGLVEERNVANFSGQCFAELESHMSAWVVETIAQGAYIREYHLWEKETKEYICTQLSTNNLPTALMKPQKRETYVDTVTRSLTHFSTPDLSGPLKEIDQMRMRVNDAKHEPGLLLAHFVSIDEYWSKLTSIEDFWERIASVETLTV